MKFIEEAKLIERIGLPRDSEKDDGGAEGRQHFRSAKDRGL